MVRPVLDPKSHDHRADLRRVSDHGLAAQTFPRPEVPALAIFLVFQASLHHIYVYTEDGSFL